MKTIDQPQSVQDVSSQTESHRASSLRPAIIIGAGRSGTNMLRDLLVDLPEFATWPCDEINYIWRHGNREFETDQFTRAMADPKTVAFIQRKFAAMAKRNPKATLVEKTCANSLRCGFVHEIFPDAKFIHIVRDGRDVAASAALRWNAKLDVKYILKKARFVPVSDLPYYGFAYLKARLFRLFSGTERLSTWGPRYEGMQDVMASHELPVACAIQWRECVESALEQLGEIPDQQVLTVRYEDFARDPVSGFESVCRFLGATPSKTVLGELAKRVSEKSIGKWKSQLNADQAAEIESQCGDLLARLGYGK